MAYQWYAIIWGVAFVTMFIISLRRSHFYVVFRYYVVKSSIIIHRRCLGIIIGRAILLVCYLATNIVLMLFPWRPSTFMLRYGMLASINIIPLFLGGRTSSLANFLGVPLHVHQLAHLWIGIVALVQGLLHAILALSWHEQRRVSGTVVALPLLFIFLSSLLFIFSSRIRRSAYQLFLQAHLIAAILSIVALLWHLLPGDFGKIFSPVTALTLWLVNEVFRMYFKGTVRKVTPIDRTGEDTRPHASSTPWAGTRVLKINVHKQARPGQYYYLRAVSAPFYNIPFLGAWWDKIHLAAWWNKVQSRPFQVAWWEHKGAGKHATELAFIISAQGRQRELIEPGGPKHVFMDGPYGQDLELWRYENVILVAEGIGITSILPYAQDLAERKRHDILIEEAISAKKETLQEELARYAAAVTQADNGGKKASAKTLNDVQKEVGKLSQKVLYGDRTRKIYLLWAGEKYQENWVVERLAELQRTNSEKFVQICGFYPAEMTGEPNLETGGDGMFYPEEVMGEQNFETRGDWKFHYPGEREILDSLSHTVDHETRRSGRRSIVVVCGSPSFAEGARQIVIDKVTRSSNVEFKEVEFRPQPEPEPEPSYVPPDTSPYDAYLRSTHPQTAHPDSPISKPRSTQAKYHGTEISSMSDSDDDIRFNAVNVRRAEYREGDLVSAMRVVTQGKRIQRDVHLVSNSV